MGHSGRRLAMVALVLPLVLGDDANEAELTALGAVVVDLTALQGQGATNHDKFAQIANVAPKLLGVLGKGIGRGGDPNSRRKIGADAGPRPAIVATRAVPGVGGGIDGRVPS